MLLGLRAMFRPGVGLWVNLEKAAPNSCEGLNESR